MPGAGPRIAGVVMAHHERLDGFGYPQGTLGASLSMAGQMVAVAEMLMGLMESGPHARSARRWPCGWCRASSIAASSTA